MFLLKSCSGRWLRLARLPLCLGVSSCLLYHVNNRRCSPLWNQSTTLEPDPRGSTYEMALYMASQRQLQLDLHRQRQATLHRSGLLARQWHTFCFAMGDYVVAPLRTLLRFLQLTTLLLLPLVATFPLTWLHRNQQLQWYRLVKSLCQFAGPSFIKLGQWASTRNDIFPQEFCDELATLHSNVTPHPFRYTREQLCDLLGVSHLDQVFDQFTETPVGCGAIAQVYLAHFRNRDEWVAIKILHPNVQQIVNRDLAIMKLLANAINWIPTMEWLSLPVEVEQFSILMNLQMDLRIEASNLQRFIHNHSANRQIKFPKPLVSLTTRSVLFEEYLDALPMSYFLVVRDKLTPEQNTSISQPFVMAFLKMLIVDDFVHADLHPGNMMIRFISKDTNRIDPSIIPNLKREYNESKNSSFITEISRTLDQYTPQICFIDAGLVTELDTHNRINFLELFNALAKFDGYRAGELMIERSRTPETAIDKDLFSMKVESLVNRIKRQTFTLGTISIGELLQQMLSMVRTHHVRMEGDFISIVVAIFLLEGIGRQLDPNLDLFESSIPILRKITLNNMDEQSIMLSDTTMLSIWLGLEIRKLMNLSIRQIHSLIQMDQLSPNV